MAILIGDVAPDFEAETTEGKIRFHDWQQAYAPFADVPNVAVFLEQAHALPELLQTAPPAVPKPMSPAPRRAV